MKNSEKPTTIQSELLLFKCGGLNDCFGIHKETSRVYGYLKKESVKRIDLLNNFEKKDYNLTGFLESYIFKVLELKKSLMICTSKNIIEIELDSMKVKRTSDLKTSGSILMETSKDEEYLFITENNNLFYIVLYKNLQVINKFKTISRFVTLSYPEKSKFIYGNIDNNPLVFYGKPEQFISGFKTKSYVTI